MMRATAEKARSTWPRARVAERAKGGCGCGGGGGCRCGSGGSNHDFLKIGVLSDAERRKMTGSAKDNVVDLTFDPATTKPVPNCTRIVTVQMVKLIADGTATLPGTYYAPWKCMDKVALADTNELDHFCTDKTPYYTDTGIGTAGHSNGGTASATEHDEMSTGGGDKKFHSAANPSGWKTVKNEFRTFAFCAEGPDCGQFYEGISWTWTKTAADAAAGTQGKAKIGSALAKPAATDSIVKAFDKFNSDRSFVPCAKKGP